MKEPQFSWSCTLCGRPGFSTRWPLTCPHCGLPLHRRVDSRPGNQEDDGLQSFFAHPERVIVVGTIGALLVWIICRLDWLIQAIRALF